MSVEWFHLTSDASAGEQHVRPAAAEPVHLPVFTEMFDRYKERLQRQCWKGGSPWVVRRWSFYDLEKFAILVDKIKGVLGTLKDAIFLTREPKERFLWIDPLCIVQDDPIDLETQIGLMGTIFEQAYCIIVAVDAKGADGSLPDRGLFLSAGNT
ncbi:uncharacterized protein DNG_07345 [Cephalotrichum gorgonifer]|uniref:Heterokaryon incompatibility domain-containing protein n=1 Tax=Cephalotrichum gorgonifer TaxID=2041049 RepID=A0AAE8N4F4_9PEZI|nr:uncharacterized protein DNG_07345 [Cephalotrichum gorgonifer]